MYKKISGIYKITCICDGKIYIGSAVNIKERWNEHLNRLRRSKHENKYLQNAFNKYKEENFIFEIIEIVEDILNLIEREQYWIDTLNACNRKIGFNILPQAGSRIGSICTQETRDKISKSLKGRKRLDLTGENNGMYGKRGVLHPNYKKPMTQEQKKKISKSLKGKYTKENSPNYSRGKRVICIDDGLIFDNLTRAGEYFNISPSSIGKVCNNKGYTTHGLRFCFLENYTQNLKNKIIYKKINCKKIICVETGIKFESIKQAANIMNLNHTCINAVLKGKQKTTGGYTFKYYEEIDK